jgi:hypothetical protein
LKYREDTKLSTRERALLERLSQNFPVNPIPTREEVAKNLEYLHEGELKEVFGKSWPVLYANREESVWGSDLFLFGDIGFAYYFPAFLSCLLSSTMETSFEDNLVDRLIIRGRTVKDRLTETQREITCEIFGIVKSAMPLKMRTGTR